MGEVFEEFLATKQAALARMESEPALEGTQPVANTRATARRHLKQREQAWDRAVREVLLDFRARYQLEHVSVEQLQDLLTLMDHLPALFLPILARDEGALGSVRVRAEVDAAQRRWAVVSRMLGSYDQDEEDSRLLAIVLAIETAIVERFDDAELEELAVYLRELGVDTTANLASELASAKPGGGARGSGNRGAARIASDLLGGGKALKDRLAALLRNA